ncbi:thiamine pyrophosphate-binding protein [Paraburkholderia phenazinium]|uniref:Acetolactate synthase-1/2/3 large subunit n=1 Tax=Paraburkholderia phenazinium TaxID=60549 RepID=A0A1G8FVJ4_9BURK|nr:thiamine pyrophosphate-binding protein [Paraburkholderia phenazinium]SDH86168.1 acetolactate synthase-1/2/3 large subunit [Paraburkholderia phenazinium]
MGKKTGNRVLAETFAAYGVDHFFNVPMIIPPGIKEMTAIGVKSVVAHSEKAAAYMADGYARESGRVGVCASQAIGATNLASGLVDALMAKSPILALTGGGTADTRERNFYQEIDQRPIYAGLTKFSARVEKAQRLPDLLQQALRVATTGSPGPVHLELSGFWGAVLMEEVEHVMPPEPRYGFCPPIRPAASAEDIRTAATALRKAERPIIVAGSGIRASRAQAALLKFARFARIPVATSLDAKAAIPESDTLCTGVVGDYSRDTANIAVSEADFVLFVGSSTGSMTTRGWSVPVPGVPAVQIDIDPRELGRNYPLIVGLIGDPAAVLEQLGVELAGPVGSPQWIDRIAALREEWGKLAAQYENSDTSPIRPERLCSMLSESLPEGALVAVDTGHAAGWAARHLYLNRSGQALIRAAGSLGWSFPASLGAKCANPMRPVVCFTGDGAFYYHLAEMETAVRYGINTVTVVNNNHGFNQERVLWGEDAALEKNWKFGRVDFAAVAETLGMKAYRVERASDFRGAFKDALAAGRPALIDVYTDPSAVVPIPWEKPKELG